MKKLFFLLTGSALLLATSCKGPVSRNNVGQDSAAGNAASRLGDTPISAGSGSPVGVNLGAIHCGSTGQAGNGPILDSSKH